MVPFKDIDYIALIAKWKQNPDPPEATLEELKQKQAAILSLTEDELRYALYSLCAHLECNDLVERVYNELLTIEPNSDYQRDTAVSVITVLGRWMGVSEDRLGYNLSNIKIANNLRNIKDDRKRNNG